MLQSADKEPFVIGLYGGIKKPNINEFLADFVDEMTTLQVNGISLGNKLLSINIHSIVCDAPARAMIKNIKGHSGFFGCERCCQRGSYLNNKVTFPETNSILRTDASFQNMQQAEHHHGSTPLSRLMIGMISFFPLDYMHMDLIGVTKRAANLWTTGSRNPYTCLPGKESVATLSDRLLKLRPFIPAEFARKPRSISELPRWKATELRSFLLYTVC